MDQDNDIMRRVRRCITFALCCWAGTVYGQLTIGECYEKARANYPLARQYGLIARTEEYNLQNAARGYLPQFSLSAKATYQTAVTELPVALPGAEIIPLTKDQYQVVAEVSQTIWDGGAIRSQKEGIVAGSDVDKQQYEVDMYALNERVNNLFFGILLLDARVEQNGIYEKELQRNYDKVASYMANGVANAADLDAVQVEQLGAVQKRVELETLREAYRAMLSALIGEPVGKEVRLVSPEAVLVGASEVERPELALLDARVKQFESQRKAVSARNLPRISAFVQGAYGNPGLNMLKEGFTPYAVGGVRLSWNFGGLYTRRNDLHKIETGIEGVETQRQTFLFNTSLQTTQQMAEIEKYRKVMRDDDRIISLRENIRRSAEAKVENGTLSVTELVREMNAEQSARQTKVQHEVELLQSIYELKNIVNK